LDDLRHEGTLEVVAAGVCLMSEEAYEWTSGQDRLLLSLPMEAVGVFGIPLDGERVAWLKRR
jgi:hypothetical protein